MRRPPERLPVACFDIFDTVLTRATGAPKSVFLLLGHELHREGRIPCSQEVFARLRTSAEEAARSGKSSGEVTLSDIYRTLRQSVGWDERAAADAARREQELERRLIRAVPRTLGLIQDARLRGTEIVFISDMYHSPDYLESLLRQAGALVSGDHLLVSSTEGCSKAQGRLFQVAAAKFGIPVTSLTHYGNDAQADVASARRLGVTASRCPDCDLTRYEAIMEDHAFATGGLSSLLAGASRQARLGMAQSPDYSPSLHDVATGVIAPFLVAYVSWVMVEAKRRGLERLYFVARDGEIMLDVARRLAPRLGVDLDLRYLFGSRQAWHLPGMSQIEQSDHAWIFEAGHGLSIEMMLRRLHLSSPEVGALLDQHGIPAARIATPITKEDRKILETLLAPGGRLAEIVLARAAEHRELLIRYLHQEGVLGRGAWGLVDIGWRGRLQHSLQRTLTLAGSQHPIGHYVGLHRGASAQNGTDAVAFLFDTPSESGWGRAPEGVAYLTEMFCQATHGMVIGYRLAGDRVVPVTDETPTQTRLDWGVRGVQEAVAGMVDVIPAEADALLGKTDLREVVRGLLDELWQRPSAAEARRWGLFPYEDDQAGSLRRALARAYGLTDAISYAATGEIRDRSVSWPAASWRLSSPAQRLALKMARAFRNYCRRLKRAVASRRNRGTP